MAGDFSPENPNIGVVMRKFALLSLVLSLSAVIGGTADAEIVTSLEEGKTLAESRNLPLVLDFGAKW